MQISEQLHLAEVLREYRERLEAVRDSGATDFDEQLAICVRMLDVENFLNDDAARRAILERKQLTGVRGWLHRMRAPRIGTLHHHPPRPLRLPSSYRRATPPTPAPTISIAVPSFRQGHFIERTLVSVLNQQYPSLELVVQDAGSQDETVEVLKRHEASLLRWASEPDDGQGDAINRGFVDTTGEIMAYLNSDDVLLPGALAYVARFFADHPDVDVLYGDRIIIDENDEQVGLWVLPDHEDETLTLVDYVPQETLFWRRSAWEQAGGQIDPSLGFAIDWDLLLRLRESGAKIVHVRRFLGAFRVHEAQKTATEDALCTVECAHLRERVHGRAVSIEEAYVGVQPYLRRHARAHVRQRVIDRLPRSHFVPDFTVAAAAAPAREPVPSS